jgi:uroporphyrinogen decarboxylase
MTSRERVFRALEFRCPDRAPRDLWALPWVGWYVPRQIEALRQRFPMDFAGCGVYGKSDRARGEASRKGSYTDEWGSVWHVAEDGVVGEVKKPILGEWSAMDTFQPPWEMIQRADVDQAQRACEKNLTAENPRFMMCGTLVRPFERMQFLRGSENLYYDLGEQSKEFFRLREMVWDFDRQSMSLAARSGSDAVSFMDDWGSQNTLLISPKQWREIFKPMYREYCEIAKKAGKKVFFHSDGYIMDIYEDLIEIGVDAVNSQLFCMPIENIAKRFKGRITFWGEIDRQHILPFGTPADVRKAVTRVRAALDDGNGGVIAQCEWGVNNPCENVEAVYAAWEEAEASGQLPVAGGQ